jgi:hypothetical protein
MAKITLGEEDYTIPELNFEALQRAWPYIEASMVTDAKDPMSGPNAALRIISAGICEGENFNPERYKVTASADDPDAVYEQVVLFFRKKLKARDIEKLAPCVDQIIEEAGLMPAGGDADTVGNVETLNHSPEIAAAS